MSIAERYFDRLTCGDIDGVVACFTADGEYHDLLIGTWSGESELRQLFERMVAEIADLSVTADRVVEAAGIEFIEWTSRYTLTASAGRAAGKTITLRGSSVFELSDGRCSVYREYFNLGRLLVDMGLDAETVYKVLSRTPLAPFERA